MNFTEASKPEAIQCVTPGDASTEQPKTEAPTRDQLEKAVLATAVAYRNASLENVESNTPQSCKASLMSQVELMKAVNALDPIPQERIDQAVIGGLLHALFGR